MMRIEVCLTMGANVSLKSIPGICENPFATSQALYCSTELSVCCLIQKVSFAPIALHPSGSLSTTSKIPMFTRDSSSFSMAAVHSLASGLHSASRRVLGSSELESAAAANVKIISANAATSASWGAAMGRSGKLASCLNLAGKRRSCGPVMSGGGPSISSSERCTLRGGACSGSGTSTEAGGSESAAGSGMWFST